MAGHQLVDMPGAGDGIEVRLMRGDLGTFGQVLADQTVGVLVRGPLPRRTRVSEVDRQISGHGHRRMLGHLGALIPGQAQSHEVRQPLQMLDQHISDTVGLLALGQTQDQRVPGGALHQRDRR